MEEKNGSGALRSAFAIGSVCVLTYLMSYYMRNLLSVVTPQLLNTAEYTEESAALLSSVYMIVYAAGQLVNGTIGDYLKPKYMVLAGYLLGGTALTLFPLLPTGLPQVFCFALLGFGFSMLRGPLVKTISENTLPGHARVCCVFLSVSGYFGPLLASLFSLFFDWRTVFSASGVIAFATGVGAFLCLTLLEKKGVIRPYVREASREKKETGLGAIFSVFRIPGFPAYMVIGIVTEIIGTSVSFWIPTFFHQHLGFSEGVSGLIYSGVSLGKSVAPFACLLLFRLFGEDDTRLMRTMFCVSLGSFLLMLVVPFRWCQILLLLLALMSNSCAASALWTIYIPGLAKSGRVSGANGVLDGTGYLCASAANLMFAAVMRQAGWIGTIGTWAAVALAGIVITLFIGRKKAAASALSDPS